MIKLHDPPPHQCEKNSNPAFSKHTYASGIKSADFRIRIAHDPPLIDCLKSE